MMHADSPMDLVVQPDLAARLILVAGELDPVHPQIGSGKTGPIGVLGVDLRKGNEWAAVPRPALDLGQVADAGPMSQDRPGPHASWQEPPEGARDTAISPGTSSQGTGIRLQLDQPP